MKTKVTYCLWMGILTKAEGKPHFREPDSESALTVIKVLKTLIIHFVGRRKQRLLCKHLKTFRNVILSCGGAKVQVVVDQAELGGKKIPARPLQAALCMSKHAQIKKSATSFSLPQYFQYTNSTPPPTGLYLTFDLLRQSPIPQSLDLKAKCRRLLRPKGGRPLGTTRRNQPWQDC